MTEPSAGPEDLHRRRLFFGICLALIPTGASFALVSNILVPLKQQFILTNYQVGLIGGAALWGMAISLLVMGPLLEGFGLKNGARLAFLGHLAGISLMISAASRAGDPSAFWLLLVGAATLAAGNGMIEVTGNPLVAAALHQPDRRTPQHPVLRGFHCRGSAGTAGAGYARRQDRAALESALDHRERCIRNSGPGAVAGPLSVRVPAPLREPDAGHPRSGALTGYRAPPWVATATALIAGRVRRLSAKPLWMVMK